MKKLHIFFFLIFLGACRKDSPELVVPTVIAGQKLPEGIEGLSVEGVPKTGILFTNLNSNGSPSWVQITLPLDYAFGKIVTLSFDMAEGYGLALGNGTELNPDEMKLDYEGLYFEFNLITPEKEIQEQIYIQVLPTAPLVAPSVGRPHELINNGYDLTAMVPVENWGTNYILDDSLTRKLGGGRSILRNMDTGKITVGGAGFNSFDYPYLTVPIPETIEEGEYELTLFRDHRSVIVPDKIIIKYGTPVIRPDQFYNISIFYDSGYVVTYHGYNLVEEHKYELELKSDLIGSKRFTLVPVDHLTLQTKLPLDFPRGTYEVNVWINGKETKYWNGFTGANLLFVRTNTREPTIGLLSQRSQAYGPNSYTPVKSLNRNEDIIMYGESSPNLIGKPEGDHVARLLLKSIASDQQYVLPLSDSVAPIALTYFPQFKITDEVVSGDYEVRLSIRSADEKQPRISGPYYKIITIQ